MLRKLTLLVTGLTLFISTAKAQDPEFSQFYAAPLYLNPAFAGNGGPKVHLNYRNQWPDINKAYRHLAASYDQSVGEGVGLGMLITTDDQGNGIYKANNIGGIFAYQIKAGGNFIIKPAVQATYSQRILNTNNLVYKYNQDGTIDNTASLAEPSVSPKPKNFVDFAAGMLLYSENLFAGLAIDHLFQPDQSLTDNKSILPRKVTGHIGAIIPLEGGRGRSERNISPNLMYQKQGSFNQLNAGVYYNAGQLVLGGWYRYSFTNGDAFIALIGFKPGILRVGYSYDFTTSALRSNSGGAHEVSLALEFDKVYRRNGARYKKINCPTF